MVRTLLMDLMELDLCPMDLSITDMTMLTTTRDTLYTMDLTDTEILLLDPSLLTDLSLETTPLELS